jgi:hypothetical protein
MIPQDDGINHDAIVPPHSRLSVTRNLSRIKSANDKDTKTLGTYLPSSASSLFSDVVWGPNNFFEPPIWLLLSVAEVAAAPVPTPAAPTVQFEVSELARNHNTKLLQACNGNLQQFLKSQQGSTLDYGTEFRPVIQLSKVLGTHPNFPFFRSILTNGMSYHFTRELSEDERMQELTLQLARGNHNSAKEKEEVAARLLLKDVTHGFSLPVWADYTFPKSREPWLSPVE